MWLGRFAAEPQRQADSTIAFFIQGDEPGRVSQFTAAPVTRDDLQGPLKDEWNALRAKLAKAKPATSSERALRDALCLRGRCAGRRQRRQRARLRPVQIPPGREPWRLVWCWGYQRADAQPRPRSSAPIPTVSNCFSAGPAATAAAPAAPTWSSTRWRRPGGARVSRCAALLVLLALLGLIYFGGQHRLTVTPASWEGPIGSRVAFHVTDRSWFWHEEDVTGRTTPLAHDTRVIRFEPHDCVGIAPGVGSTQVSFHYGGLSTDVEVVALPADGLTGFCLAPAVIDLASGSTAELKALAKDAKGREHDLTASVDWQSLDPAVALAQPGLVEGAEPGETVVEVRYVPKPARLRFWPRPRCRSRKSISPRCRSRLEPGELAIGQRSARRGFRRYGRCPILVRWLVAIGPLGRSGFDCQSRRRRRRRPCRQSRGAGRRRRLEGRGGPGGQRPPAAAKLVVKPLEAKLAVGERLKLDVLAPGSEPLAAASADPKIVSTPSPRELLGEAAGTTEVRITQGKQEQVVKVKVEPAAIESLRIGPAQLTVNVGTTAPLRVIGTLAGGREIDLDPESLTWVKQPLADRAKFDRQALLVTGLAPTDESEPLEVHYKELSAKAEVKVQGDPKRVSLRRRFSGPSADSHGRQELVDAATGGADATGTPTLVGPKVAGTDTPAVTVPATGDVPAGAPVVTTGPYLGDSVALRDGKLVVGDTAADSAPSGGRNCAGQRRDRRQRNEARRDSPPKNWSNTSPIIRSWPATSWRSALRQARRGRRFWAIGSRQCRT